MKAKVNYEKKTELRRRVYSVEAGLRELKVSSYVPEVVAYFPEYSEKKAQLRKIMRGSVTENDEQAVIALEETLAKLKAYYKRISQ
jgi:hypothetical protein